MFFTILLYLMVPLTSNEQENDRDDGKGKRSANHLSPPEKFAVKKLKEPETDITVDQAEVAGQVRSLL